MEKTPILVLIQEIRDEAENATVCFSAMTSTACSQREKRIANDNYVTSVKQILALAHAIEKLNT